MAQLVLGLKWLAPDRASAYDRLLPAITAHLISPQCGAGADGIRGRRQQSMTSSAFNVLNVGDRHVAKGRRICTDLRVTRARQLHILVGVSEN